MTGREAISAQDIGFLGVSRLVGVDCFDVAVGVAGGVNGSEVSEVDSWGVMGGVSINVGSLDGAGVAGGVRSAIVVIVASSAFGVEGDVGIEVNAFGVASAVGMAISLAGFAGFFAW